MHPIPPNSGPADASAGRAWTREALADPHAQPDKARRVREMFAAIAGRYDLNNRVHSLGRDQAWRRFAVRAADVRPGDVVVDVACGTGDLTEAFARRSPASRVIGIDFTPEMLDIARAKLARRPMSLGSRVEYRQGDAMALDLPERSADVLSIAFGIRNVQEPARALAEFARVLKPGGRLVVLEFDRPRLAPVRWCNDLYTARIMPHTATWLSGDRSGAYRYLPRSVGTFMTAEELGEQLRRVGFADVRTARLTLGICACTRALRHGG